MKIKRAFKNWCGCEKGGDKSKQKGEKVLIKLQMFMLKMVRIELSLGLA